MENDITDYDVMYKIVILFILTAFIIKHKSIIIINITSWLIEPKLLSGKSIYNLNDVLFYRISF